MIGPTVTDAGWRRSNLGHLLFVATGRCVAEVVRVAETGGVAVVETQLGLLHSLNGEGARLTKLAERAGVAKQSSIELVDRAVRAGLAVRLPDPADARAKIIRLTPDGVRLRVLAEQGSAAAENGMTAAIGAPAVRAVRLALAAYTALAKASPIDQLLARAARRFVRDVLAAVHRHGYREVTEAMLALFRHLDLDGARLTDVATAARITKQSMGGLVARAEALGLVERALDPGDRRASIIRFTKAGLVMLDAFRVGVEAAEGRFVVATDASLPALKAALSDYLAAGNQPARYSASRNVASGGGANSPG